MCGSKPAQRYAVPVAALGVEWAVVFGRKRRLARRLGAVSAVVESVEIVGLLNRYLNIVIPQSREFGTIGGDQQVFEHVQAPGRRECCVPDNLCQGGCSSNPWRSRTGH